MYVGDALICEVQLWRGVRIRPLYDYVGRHCLRFRRDAAISEDERWKLVLHAVFRLRQRYSLWVLPLLWFQSKLGFWRPELRHLSARALICSQLYSDAFAGGTGRLLVQRTLNANIPAELSLTPVLQDVDVDWLRIE